MGMIQRFMRWIGLDNEPVPPRHPWMKAMDRIKIQHQQAREKESDGNPT